MGFLLGTALSLYGRRSGGEEINTRGFRVTGAMRLPMIGNRISALPGTDKEAMGT
ncbi:hypothetical protein GCM10027038_48100 [Arthrobacter bambusae]